MKSKIVVLMCVLSMASLSFGDILIGNFEEDGMDFDWWVDGMTSTIVTGTGNTLDDKAVELVNVAGGWGDVISFALLGTPAQAALANSGTVTVDITAYAEDFPLGYSSVGLMVATGLGEEGGWAQTWWNVHDWQDIVFDSTTSMEFVLTDEGALDAIAGATGWCNIGILFYVDDNPADDITGLPIYESMATYYLDNVQVVPEPATLTMLAIGTLAMLRRRKS